MHGAAIIVGNHKCREAMTAIITKMATSEHNSAAENYSCLFKRSNFEMRYDIKPVNLDSRRLHALSCFLMLFYDDSTVDVDIVSDISLVSNRERSN